ncbi:MAG: transketolase [Candidatus Nanopelagicales bacterium]
MTFNWCDLDDKAVTTARLLALDAVEKAGHGHPGTAMALAPLAHLLFNKVMRHDPADPNWLGRDRLILSCGHASMLLYAQLFLNGYGLTLDDLKKFRTLDSLTPGHPEFGHTKGVEMTTGPLGQGLATAVGVALANRYSHGLLQPELSQSQGLFSSYTYVIASDGDLQEGITSEASSLAGHLKLDQLIVFWDDNQISIDGDTNRAFTEDVKLRYQSYGWTVFKVETAPSGSLVPQEIYKVIEKAKAQSGPCLIQLQSQIAWPAPNAKGTAASHGAPLGEAEAKATRELLGQNPEETFQVSPEVLDYTRESIARGKSFRAQWNEHFEKWTKAHPEREALLARLLKKELPADLAKSLPQYELASEVSSRKASGQALNALAEILPELIGGSADLSESNQVALKNSKSMQAKGSLVSDGDIYGRYLNFGIREHAMGAIINGIALHGLLRPFGATFLIFSDYQKPSVRLAALMGLPSIYVYSHDSIGLGEDGPTHQPIEQLWSLRAIPNFAVIRPADANETAAAWLEILKQKKPAALILSRQNLLTVTSPEIALANLSKGGYILSEGTGTPQAILLATGSEVALAIKAQADLAKENISTRVVSLPCLEWFDAQPEQYRESVLSEDITNRVAIEAGSGIGWHKYVGSKGFVFELNDFGLSAKPIQIYSRFNMTVEKIVEKVKAGL